MRVAKVAAVLVLVSVAAHCADEPTNPARSARPSIQAAAASNAGSRIAFASDRDGNFEIYEMNADGSDQTRVTTNEADDLGASWSPGGGRLAFWSNRDGNAEIYVMNADGSGQFTEVVLRPRVTILESDRVDAALAIHEKAHGLCFIARSVNFGVRHEPLVSVGV